MLSITWEDISACFNVLTHSSYIAYEMCFVCQTCSTYAMSLLACRTAERSLFPGTSAFRFFLNKTAASYHTDWGWVSDPPQKDNMQKLLSPKCYHAAHTHTRSENQVVNCKWHFHPSLTPLQFSRSAAVCVLKCTVALSSKICPKLKAIFGHL